MMRLALIVIFILLFTHAFSQDEKYVVKPPRDYQLNPAKNSIFVELGGNAGVFSLNIDRIYYYKPTFKISARFGAAVDMNHIYFEPIAVIENNFIFFKNPHHLEMGLGATLKRRYNEKISGNNDYFWENILFGVTRIGYRFQKQDDGVFIRAALTPVVTSNDALGFHANYFQLWAGASIGISF